MAATTAPQDDVNLVAVSEPIGQSLQTDKDSSSIKESETEQATDEAVFPRGATLALILTSVLMAMFLVALDRTIIATAIPHITDDFHSLGDIGWYASAYMITNSSFQLIFGRIYKFYSVKWVFLLAIGIFEIGSAICGAAPNSMALIVGRAIAGLGSAGIFSGAMMILVKTIPLHRRPMYAGLFGAVFGTSSVVGPLLGGAFTDNLSWRWCFWINLPVGAFTVLAIALILQVPSSSIAKLSIPKQLAQLDLLGTACFLPCNVCLILALQWGGSTYSWSDKRIIALLIIFMGLLVVFVVIQLWKGDAGTVPPRIICQRSVAFGFLFSICAAGSLFIIIYYLPIWFQAIQNVDAVESGIRTLPIVISMVISSIVSGAVTMKLGYYTPSMITAPIFMSIGAGLITTFMPDTGSAKWIGYQVIFGLGVGAAIQAPSLAAQAVLPKDDVSIGVSLMMFSQQLGGAIFVAVGQNIFASRLVSGLEGIPGLELDMVVNVGATEITGHVAPQYLKAVLGVYNYALTKTFEVGLITSSVMMIGALGMEWKSIKKAKQEAMVYEQEATGSKTE